MVGKLLAHQAQLSVQHALANASDSACPIGVLDRREAGIEPVAEAPADFVLPVAALPSGGKLVIDGGALWSPASIVRRC